MNVSIKNESPISRVKYVNNNSILTDNVQNQVFKKFMDFVDRMLLFYSLDSRGYEGFTNGNGSVAEGIVNSGKVQDFQNFLKDNGIDYELYGCEVDGRKAIYCHFDNKDADFFKIASTGTRSLALFYYWYIRMKKASFVFIDEFDAFYHYEMAENVDAELAKIGFENLGVEERKNLAVLRRTTMPAILIETGFIDSDKDNYLFDYRFEDIVNAIALGIDETLRG